ncbi:MAG: lysozyme [Alphaproteobacteria bacterium]
MRTSEAGIALIKHFEGFSALPYRCPAGYLTIGYGHLLTGAKGEPAQLDAAGAETLLRADLRLAEEAVGRLIARALAQCQFDALASFTFNLGAGALQRSTLRRCVDRGEDRGAAQQFLRWVFARGRKLPGLVRRRSAEAALYQGFPRVCAVGQKAEDS